MPTTKFSFSTTALYLIDDVAKYGSIRPDILTRWESLQNIMQLIKNSTNDELCSRLPALLKQDIALFDLSTPSWLASTLTLGWVGGSCRYATYLKDMLTEFNKTQELDSFDAKNKGPVAEQAPSAPAPTNLQSPPALVPTIPSYNQVVTAQTARNIVSQTAPIVTTVTPAATLAITRINELLNAYRQQVVSNLATTEISETLNRDAVAALETATVSKTYYNRYTAWQLLNITYIEKNFGVNIEVDNIKKNVSYLNNLIMAFSPYFMRKDSSAAINLSLPEYYDELEKDLKSIKDSVLKNPSSRDALKCKLTLNCDRFKIMIKENIEALDASKTPRTFTPELINAFIDAIYRMINTSKKFKPDVAAKPVAVLPEAAEVARVVMTPR